MENTHLDPARGSPHHPTPGPTPPPPAGTPAGTPAADSAAPELRSLGDFRVLRRLGEGGMGAVYLAYDGRHERHVALKVVNDSVASNQAYIDRFYREVRSGTALNHPNIVRTYTAGQDRTTRKYYLVLEYVDGPSAHALLERHGRLSVGDAVHVALDIARALEHAHSRSIIHRDIKPDNILITRSGVAKLGDLGLAKRTDEASHLTSAKQGFGTTAYMPYEQAISAKHADGRSDIYALGATLYHLLTGVVPFPGDNHLEVVEKKNVGHFTPAGKLNEAVPLALDLILGRMLARQPRDRYQTASELIIDLERSRLSVAVPSFADPEMAKKDPWVQATATTGEPTRLDPERATSDDEEWEVHYRNRAGRALTTRLTAEEIVERLQEDTLPADAEARRPGEEKWRPLAQIAPFRDHLPAEEKPQEKPAPPSAGAGAVAAVVASCVLVLGGVVGLVLWLMRGG